MMKVIFYYTFYIYIHIYYIIPFYIDKNLIESMQKLVQDNVYIDDYWNHISKNSLFSGTKSSSQLCKRWKRLVESTNSNAIASKAVIEKYFPNNTNIITELDNTWENMKKK